VGRIRYQIHSDVDMLETMASIDGPVLALLDEIAQKLSGFGSGNKAAEKFSDRSLFIRKMEEQHGQYPKRGSMLLVGHTRNKTAKASVGLHRSVSTSQVGQIRGARRFWKLPVAKTKWTEGGRLQRIDRHGGRNLCRTRGERVRNHHGRRR